MAKMTKSQIIEGLKKIGGYLKADAETQAEIDYIVGEYEDNERNVTLDDIKPVLKSVEAFAKKPFMQILAEAEGKPVQEELIKGEAIKEVKKENSTKKGTTKKALVKKTDKAETSKKVENKKETTKEAPKTEPKKEEVKKEETTKKTNIKTKSASDLVIEFPQTIESKALNATLIARPDLKNIEDISKSYAEGVDFVLACYWNRRQLKQYANSYDPMNINPNKPASFENDLDLVELTYANNLVATGVSLFSSVPSIFLPNDFLIDEESHLRYANGVEFEVYEIVSNEGEEQ